MYTNYDSYIKSRWDGKQKEQKEGHPVPFPIVAAMGLAGECGEAVEHLKKHFRDGKHPGVALKLELGDVLHYLTVIAGSYGWTLDDLAIANIDKLNDRDAGRRHG